MKTNALNPFPDYAVTRLGMGQGAEAVTIITPAIAKGRELVKTYIAGADVPLKPGQTNAALCAVRGDYGTGKTHLLNDVAAQLQKAFDSSGALSILRATCIETDPLSWFRAKVGERLSELPLDDTVLRLYGSAGKTVAATTELTAPAADVLNQDPTRIRELIRQNRLSIDEVEREFERQLGAICKDYEETVRRVLACLVSSETEGPARKWISGATLPAREAELLGVPLRMESADQASAVIGAIAAIHKAVGRPFILLVDELEHFTRFDVAHRSWGNVTWLKRLLEELGNAGALALVSGHWTAWETTKDYLDRFPQYAPIDLLKLAPADVVSLITKFIGDAPEGLGETEAQVIVTVTDGNMRRVMSLCNLLFRRTDGFKNRLTERQIHEAWTSVAQRIPQQQALEKIANLLEVRGWEVNLDATFQAIPFDMVARRENSQAILVQAKHSTTQSEHYDAARKFIDKLEQVGTPSQSAIGIFLANGSIDDELLGILRGSGIPSLRWFDLTARDVIERIQAELSAIDGRQTTDRDSVIQPDLERAGSAPVSRRALSNDTRETEAAKLKVINAELQLKLQELDARRLAETRALKERLTDETNSPRESALREEADFSLDGARASYEAMLEPPSLSKKLRYLGPALLLGITSIAVGMFVLFAHEYIYSWLTPKGTSAFLPLTMILTGIVLTLSGVWTIWHRYGQVVEFFEFSRQTIRDLYVRDVPIRDLALVNAVFRRAVNRYGPYRAREAVFEQLASEQFPPAVRYYAEGIGEIRDPEKAMQKLSAGGPNQPPKDESRPPP